MRSEKIKMRSVREDTLKSTQEKTNKYNANAVGAGLVPAQNNHAITLIALIITIIILLILAGVTLNLTIGENGLFGIAKEARDEYKKAQEDEQNQLDEAYAYLNGEGLPENTSTTNAGTNVKLPDKWATITPNYISDENGKVVVASTITSTVYAVSDGKGNTVPVPLGFYYVGGTINTGVVISDNKEDQYDGKTDKTTWEYTRKLKGNQFVWIPCKEEEYKKTSWGKQSSEWDETIPKAELTQIEKYEGFYVARYEAGLAEIIPEFTETQTHTGTNQIYNKEGIPQSKAGIIPWNFINWHYAKTNAESMYKNNYVSSGLITGTQWDVILNTMINKGQISNEDVTSSNNWGNYRNTTLTYTGRLEKAYYSSNKWYIQVFGSETVNGTTSNYTSDYTYGDLLTTGASSKTERYHIFDMAGNLWEWTEENSRRSNSEQYPILRGGAFIESYSSYPACYRSNSGANNTTHYFGFRVVLYIK